MGNEEWRRNIGIGYDVARALTVGHLDRQVSQYLFVQRVVAQVALPTALDGVEPSFIRVWEVLAVLSRWS